MLGMLHNEFAPKSSKVLKPRAAFSLCLTLSNQLVISYSAPIKRAFLIR